MKVCGSGGVAVEVWRCGGVEVWRCGGVEVWRCGGVEVWRGVEVDRCGEAWRCIVLTCSVWRCVEARCGVDT